MKHFLISSGIIAASCNRSWNEFSKNHGQFRIHQRNRSWKADLNERQHTGGKSGMDKESMLMWSYGKLETLNLFIPRLMGGGSQEPEGKEMMAKIQELVQENVGSQAEYDRISKGLESYLLGRSAGNFRTCLSGSYCLFLAV
jgi:hypothetical protein